METVYNFNKLPALRGSVITIGAFDGVHLGHQGLIQQTLATARTHDLPAWVVTFDPLPRFVLSKGKSKQLSTLQDRLDLIDSLDIDGTLVLPFDETMINMLASDFVSNIAQHLNPASLWVGKDFRFGSRGLGDNRLLRKLSTTYGYTLGEFEDVLFDGYPVHSSSIRTALRAGNLTQANACLGRSYHITGTVGHGDKRGRTLGFPTANLIAPENILIPAKGVYVCEVHLARGTYKSITNVGTRPTFNNRPATVEAHLLDFSGDIYDETITVEFLHHLRQEMKFNSAKELIEQMCLDRQAAEHYFSQRCL